MTDIAIEKLLRAAPCPAAPPELVNRLQAQIVLPTITISKRNGTTHAWRNPLRRWFPALAFGLFLLSCVFILGVQALWLSEAKRENERLKTIAAGLPQLRAEHARLELLRVQSDELALLQEDHDNLVRLRDEAVRLREIAREMESLKSENQSLSASASGVARDFFEEAETEMSRIRCVNNMKQLGLAVRIWAGDNNENFPTSFIVMSNELNTVKVLICPGDPARHQYWSSQWHEFQDYMSSYQLFTTGGRDDIYPDSVLSKCPIHSNYGRADGSVSTIAPGSVREVWRDRRLYLEKNQ